MTDDRDPFAAFRPVAAGLVVASGERRAVGLRAGQDVMFIRSFVPRGDDFTLLGERGLLVQVVVAAVQIGHVFRNDNAFGVLPRTGADAILGVDRLRTLRAEIGAPCPTAGARRSGHRLAELVGAFETAEVGALAGADAG